MKAYNEAERQFFKGYQGKFLNFLNLWINMLLCDKGILQLRSDLLVLEGMQEDPSLTRVGKRFRGNSENMEHYQGRHREKTPERFSECLRQTPVLLVDISTHTTSPPE